MGRILDTINEPRDLKRLSKEELINLSQEIREEIIDVVSKNGGHLSSNLGVVELTLALHFVFDTPVDKILWDVGHQCYTHKLITGRRNRFKTLRQYKGIGGFPNIEESSFDIYNTGHASTSLSAALGMAVARDLKGEDFYIIAVVGDGSLTGGMALEALNQIGHLKKKLIIILNDNEMSISPNVGAISGYLNYLVSGQFFRRAKELTESAVKSIPAVGRLMFRVTRRFEEAVKKMLIPGSLFEDLGIKYMGPVRGHNIEMLIQTFYEAKKYNGPILIHTVTRKGMGYIPAQKEPSKFHSASPFDKKTGKFIVKDSPPTYSSIFGKTSVELAERDKRVIAITAAMPEGTGLMDFSKKFPNRFFDVGIAEQHAVNFACGLALQGYKPVVAIYSTFLQRAYDQIYHDVSLMNVPILFCLDRSGIVSDDGPTHQGIFDMAYLRPFPNVIIMAPKDENELRHMMYTGYLENRPVFIRYPKGYGIGIDIDKEFRVTPIGKSEILKDGDMGVIISIGSMVYPCLRVAQKLEREGKNLKVINARYVKPLDTELLLELSDNYNYLITAEEGIVNGGFGSAVREFFDSKQKYSMKILSLGIPDVILPHGKREEILKLIELDEESTYRRIKNFLESK
ncbi:MAG: 1-deoxy-D-xylulose-5-phosphate synthase [Acidobacteriota bacterium]